MVQLSISYINDPIYLVLNYLDSFNKLKKSLLYLSMNFLVDGCLGT